MAHFIRPPASSGPMSARLIAVAAIHVALNQPIALRIDGPCRPETRKCWTIGHCSAPSDIITTVAIHSVATPGNISTSGASTACATITSASALRGDIWRSSARTILPALTANTV